jgi:hypothetical protein
MTMPLDPDTRQRLLAPVRRIVAEFNESDWRELGVLTGCYDIIESHP